MRWIAFVKFCTRILNTLLYNDNIVNEWHRMKIYNFSAGPAALPHEVLKLAQTELLDWDHTGASVMELSHRGKEFDAYAIETTNDLRDILHIPANYKVLFLQSGIYKKSPVIIYNLTILPMK